MSREKQPRTPKSRSRQFADRYPDTNKGRKRLRHEARNMSRNEQRGLRLTAEDRRAVDHELVRRTRRQRERQERFDGRGPGWCAEGLHEMTDANTYYRGDRPEPLCRACRAGQRQAEQ